ncbi:MAG: hypothetical protein ACP6IY_17565 [Promethearchaeia archaeon]
MIRDLVIIKDGMPLLTKSFSGQDSPFKKTDNLIMLSGFFTAINSFSDQFEGLGSVSELRLSNAEDMKISFLRDPSLPNLIYVATFDDQSKSVNVQRALRKISKTFIKKYNIEKILNWRGRKDTFKAFEEVLEQYIIEEKEESEKNFKEKVITLFNNVKEKLEEDDETKKSLNATHKPEFFDLIPIPKIKGKINPKYYISGKKSLQILSCVDGSKTIEEISKELKIAPEEIFKVCKNLVKLGFLSF